MRPLERWLVRWSTWATGITGIVYLWMKYLLEPMEPFAVVNHPLQPWVLKAHILAAPIMVFAVGMISLNHVVKHLRGRVAMGRRTGVSLGLSLVPMILTGYLIQVIIHPGWRPAAVWTHIGLGVLFLVAFAAHLAVFRRGSRRGSVRRGTDRVPVQR